MQPQIVVRNRHRLERHLFRVLEESVGSPYIFEPRDRQQTVVSREILWEAEAMVLPALGEEDVRGVGLWGEKETKGVCEKMVLLPIHLTTSPAYPFI